MLLSLHPVVENSGVLFPPFLSGRCSATAAMPPAPHPASHEEKLLLSQPWCPTKSRLLLTNSIGHSASRKGSKEREDRGRWRDSPGLTLQPVSQEMPKVLGKVNVEPLQFFRGHLGNQTPQRHDLGCAGCLGKESKAVQRGSQETQLSFWGSHSSFIQTVLPRTSFSPAGPRTLHLSIAQISSSSSW